jgi:chromosome segregation ATPase
MATTNKRTAVDDSPKRLTELQVENYKRIVFLDLKLKPGITEISGRNGAGKSSALDAVAVWLDGMKVAPAEPIRQGAERSRIRGRLGEMYVTRTLRKLKGGTVTNEISFQPIDGKPYPATQKMLDDLIGEHRLDPLDFIALDRKGKFAEFQAFVTGFDFAKATREHAGEYARRTEVNRLARDARAAASLISVPSNLPKEAPDERGLIDELQRAGDQNAETERRRGNRQRAIETLEQCRAVVASAPSQIEVATQAAEQALEQEIARLRAAHVTRLASEVDRITGDMRAAQARIDDLQAKIEGADPLPEIVDTVAVAKRIEEARQVNAALTKLAERRRHESAAKKWEDESAELSASIEARQTAREKAISEAKLPIAGIEFGDEEILLNGVPFDQASTAQKLRVAMALIVARSPSLRLAWIRDASLLDDESYAEMQRLAAEYDCDILIETVRPIGKDAVVLEDGRLKQSDTEEAQATGSLL